MMFKDFGKFELQWCYVILVVVVLESIVIVIDELVDLYDCILVKLFSGVKYKYQQQFQKQGKVINDKVCLYLKIGQVLLEVKENGSDLYVVIEVVIFWDEFIESVSEVELLVWLEGFDYLYLVGENFVILCCYMLVLLEVLELCVVLVV